MTEVGGNRSCAQCHADVTEVDAAEAVLCAAINACRIPQWWEPVANSFGQQQGKGLDLIKTTVQVQF